MTLLVERTPLEPPQFLQSVGAIFAVFDSRTQDSGNVSFGVEVDGERYFVKTAGNPSAGDALLDHAGRVAVLENAALFARSVSHSSLPQLLHLAMSAWGPMLVYTWVDGDLIHAPHASRTDPRSAFQRFRALPLPALVDALGVIIDAHAYLAEEGWIACDLYDGSIIYDFKRADVHLVDLDHYHRGPFVNEMGRMLGSTRFMAPEEFVMGAPIDESTTTFTLGRMVSEFVGDGTLRRETFRGSDDLYALMVRACAEERRQRFQQVAALARHWRTVQ